MKAIAIDSSIEPKPPARRPIAVAALLCIIFLSGVIPLILTGYDQGRGAYDQNNFHLIAIRTFAKQFPRVDFSDYPSATTPGFHVFVAAFARYVSGDLRLLRLAGLLFSIGLIATVGIWTGRRAGMAAAVMLCLPMICSLYVVSSGAWLLPDNAGWWGVVGILLISLRPKVDAITFILGGLVFLALLLVRQSHAWALAPLFMAAWIGGDGAAKDLRSRVVRVSLMAVAMLPALLALLYFFRTWHGLVPPNQRGLVGGGNSAGPMMVLAVSGTLGLFFVPVALRRPDQLRKWLPVLAGAVSGLVIGLLPATRYNQAAGRFSGLWNISQHFPTIGARSWFMIALAILGGAIIGGWFSLLPSRQRWIWFAATAAFVTAQLAGHYAAQRYDEPLVLIAAALSLSDGRQRLRPIAMASILLICVLLLSVTVFSLR